MDSEKVKKVAAEQATAAAVGATFGAITKSALPSRRGTPVVAQVTSAMGAAGRKGGGVGGAVAAGTAVVAGKVAVVTAAAAAAAPVVAAAAVVGGTVWGIIKLVDYLDS